MGLLVNLVGIGLGLLFLTIPIFNKNVFHAVDIGQVTEEGKDGFRAINESLAKTDYVAVRDTARSLIERFRSDSTRFFAVDVASWDSVVNLIKRDKDDLATNLLLPRLRPEDLDTIRTLESQDTSASSKKKGVVVGYKWRMKIVDALNEIVADPALYVTNADKLPVSGNRECRQRYDQLVRMGVLTSGMAVPPKAGLTPAQVRQLRAFHCAVLAQLVYPQFLQKDPKRNTDWASEYIAQTAYYFIASTYRIQFKPDEAVAVYDTLIDLYPRSIYAEQIFLTVGQMLNEDGKSKVLGGDLAGGSSKLHQAISYLEKIEKNREIAKEFPKYKHVELAPGTYTNIDESSKAKQKIKQKTRVYTSQEAKNDLAGKSGKDEGGHVLEDAVKLVGECYILLGKTDSARAQFKILQDFFPESDNLDDAQKLIADSYAKDGDMLRAGRDSASADVKKRVEEAYLLAIKEYQQFVNVYSQSNLISGVYISMGDTYNKLGRAGDAAKAFFSALDLAKVTEDKARIQMQIGNYYNERKRYADAIKAYDVILVTFSSTKEAASAQYLLGKCYMATGDTAKALEGFKKVVDYYKQSEVFATSALEVGQHYDRLGDYKVALDFYKKGYTYSQTGPLAPRLLLNMGLVWVKIAESGKGDEQKTAYDEAIKQFKKVAEVYAEAPEADNANYELTQAYHATNRDDAGRKTAKQIQRRDLKVRAIKIFMVLDSTGGELAEANQELDYWKQQLKDATDDEERATIWNEVAAVQLEKGKDPQAAFDAYSKALELSKDVMKRMLARIGISGVYMSQKKYAESAALVKSIIAEEKRLTPEMRQQLQIRMYDAQAYAGELDSAFQGFDAFATQYPEHDRAGYAQYRAGSILGQQGKNKEALDRMQIVIDKYHASDVYDQAVLGRAEQMIALGQVEEGVKYLEGFLKDTPIDSIAPATLSSMHYKLAEAYREKLKDPVKARKYYSLIVDKNDPEDPLLSYAAYRLGTVLKEAGEDKAAIEALGKVQNKTPSVYRAAQAEMGKIMAKTDPEAAIKNYERIVQQSETAEDSALAMVGIGDVYVTVKKWKQAAETYEKVHAFYHGSDTTLLAGCIVKWIDALSNDKQYDKAIKTAGIMQKQFPDNEFAINAWYFEAQSWMSLKKYSQARKTFDEIIKLNKSALFTEIAYYQRGDCSFFGKDFKTAIREYDEYLKKYPEGKYRSAAYYMQGNAYWSQENFKGAEEKFRTVVTKYPDFSDVCGAKNNWAYSLYKTGRAKEALKIYNEVISGGGCSDKARTEAREKRETILTTQQ